MGGKDEVKVMGGGCGKGAEHWNGWRWIQNDMRFIRILMIFATLPETKRFAPK